MYLMYILCFTSNLQFPGFSITNGYVGSICMMSAPQVKFTLQCAISFDQDFFLKNFKPTGCSTWRRTNCRLSNGCLAWAWPGQWRLPLQLLCHAHLSPLNAIPVGKCFGNFEWGRVIKLRFESRKSKLISSILRQLALKIYCELM